MIRSERLVKEKLPSAKCETQRTGYRTYYLIRDGRAYMYLASGNTKKEAWDNALTYLEKKNAKS